MEELDPSQLIGDAERIISGSGREFLLDGGIALRLASVVGVMAEWEGGSFSLANISDRIMDSIESANLAEPVLLSLTGHEINLLADRYRRYSSRFSHRSNSYRGIDVFINGLKGGESV